MQPQRDMGAERSTPIDLIGKEKYYELILLIEAVRGA
jgi:hypothetical protein